MIFTIGNKQSYDDALRQNGAQGVKTLKVGRRDDYPGGYAFQTATDAVRRIAEAYPGRGFAIYEVDASWERDTYPSATGWWRNLKTDRPIIGLHLVTMIGLEP